MRARLCCLIIFFLLAAREFCLADDSPLSVVTNILQFDRLAEQTQRAAFDLKLEGVVRWTSADGTALVLQDESGAALVETEPQNPPLRPGEKIFLSGEASVAGNGADVRIGGRLLVKTDAAGGEKSAAIFLKAGKHPIRVSWLAGESPDKLEIYFQGPDLPRQKISNSILFHKAIEPDGNSRWIAGLEYAVFEGQWPGLPDFRRENATKTGVATYFDLNLKAREQNVALRFSGYLEAPRDGIYTFSVASSGDAELSIGLPQIHSRGMATPPAPVRLIPGQVLSRESKSAWAEAEGTVTFVSRRGLFAAQLELSSDAGRLRVGVDDGSGISPETLLDSRIRVTGICRSAVTLDGDAAAGVMWTPDAQRISVIEPASKRWQVENTNLDNGQLPTLTTLGQIMRLNREELARGYPVKIRGVVIWSGGNRFQIVDSTAGIYVDAHDVANPEVLPLRAGEFWEIEGVTEARFSPIIFARRAKRIGLGVLPEPIRATMDQLLNGSLDAQYIEVQGVVTAVQTNRLTMLTRGGKIQVYFVPPMWDGEPSVLNDDDGGIRQSWSAPNLAALESYDGALVRVRGSLSPVKNDVTLQFKVGEIQIRAGSICLDRAAPADPFSAPQKRAAELLMFDPRADPFQPVKIAGVVVQQHEGEYFLMDGNQGLRFIPKKPLNLAVGDAVEVVGLPELGGPSPLLREGDARKIGTTALPPPQRLLADAPLILNASYDATRVELQARLVSLSAERSEDVLGLQMGPHFFAARLDKKTGSLESLRVGSWLEVTGVFEGRGSAPGQGIEAFELLLNSPSDVRVLEQPSWWTLKRLAIVVSILLGVIAAASVWIGLLHRQVEWRTAQLRVEIHQREQAQQQRAIEAERSRIARDLHDDLGSSLTEISLLADAGPGAPPTLDRAGNRFKTISEKARTLVHALDVIVWLINPRKDSLPFLASYLGGYAEEYLSASAIACRLKIPMDLPSLPLSADTRHGIFLAVKESLNNVVRHARASEVILELSVRSPKSTVQSLNARELKISVSDDGRGFDAAQAPSGNGLVNLRERLARLGGRCEIQSRPGKGTTVSLTLPL